MESETESNKKLVAANYSMKKAEYYLELGNFGRACSHMMLALKLMPSLKRRWKELFADTLCRWGNILESEQRISDIILFYTQAIRVFPENEKIINNLGAHFHRLGHLPAAQCRYLDAIKVNPLYIEAHKNLRFCLAAMVKRWHFRMLNDTDRNEAFREAIMKKIKQGFNHVLDIGTGTGLLSIFAVEGKAQRIYACECSETMCDIAKDVLDYNDMDHLIELIKMNSNDMIVPRDLSDRVSLVVTETMDAGLFGENLLETLIHAWEHLLLPPLPPSTLLPPAPCIICTDKELPAVQRKNPRINGIVVPFGATLWVAAVECKEIARRYRFICKPTTVLNFSMPVASIIEEPYDSENLQSCASGYKFLSEPLRCFYVNFNDSNNLKDFMNGKFDDECLNVQFILEGRLDAFVVWFELHLDEDIKLSSSPISKNVNTCCWDQAVFPSLNEINVTSGTTADINVKTKNGKLCVELVPTEDLTKNCRETLLVSQEMVKFLNNRTLIDNLHIESQQLVGVTSVLDLTPFPFMGLTLAALSGALCCFVAEHDEDIIMVQKVASESGIPIDKFKYVLRRNFTSNSFNLEFDLIVANLFHPMTLGDLSEEAAEDLTLARDLLKEGGKILPQTVSLWGQLVSSEQLKRSSEVLCEGIVEKYSLPKFMNEFKASHQLDLNVNSLKYEPLTEPVMLHKFTVHEIISEKELTFKSKAKVTLDGKVYALIYWFQYSISSNSCDKNQLSTRADDSHSSQVAALFNEEFVTKQQEVTVLCKYQRCAFLFKLKT